MKYVYLFELDSVRKTDEEVIIGQRALFNEITANGNIVVLTFNQLVDSRGFFSLFAQPQYYHNIINLFEKGAIRISQFEDVRTIAQYLINSFDYEKEFIYSGWPLKSAQKRLLALIKRSLINCDLTEIYGYVNNERTDRELFELFVEVNEKQELTESTKNIHELRNIVKKLYWLLKTVLRLSAMHNIYIAPKSEDEYKDKKLTDILKYVVEFTCPEDDYLWSEAVSVITNLKSYGNTNNRSKILREIKVASQDSPKANQQVYMYAEAIVNACYNYTCEISINNISKHYDINELSASACYEKISFRADFFSRLQQDWNIKDRRQRYLQDETDVFDEFLAVAAIPDFSEAVRLCDYSEESCETPADDIHRYEFDLKKQQKERRKSILKSIGKKVLFSLICVLIACCIEIIFNIAQDRLEVFFDTNTFVMGLIKTIFFLFVTEGITAGLSKLLSDIIPGFMSLSEAIGGISRLLQDAIQVIFKKRDTYKNNCRHNLQNTENRNKTVPIKSSRSIELRKYIEMTKLDDKKDIFRKSTVYPIADIKNQAVVEELLRLEELYNYHFGVTYKSKYNMMLTDPICSSSGSFFPYERVIPSSGNGVVMVTVHKGKYILLHQYRHSLRQEQYCFPRGYGEEGLLSRENAIKELKEEINAQIKDEPVYLGKVCPDSGLTSGCANVFLVEVDCFCPKVGHEGISSCIELTDEEFMKFSINDGFTLSAYLLHKKYLMNQK